MAIQRMANLPLLRSFPPSSEAAPADYPVRRLTIQCSLWDFHLLSFNLLTLGYYRLNYTEELYHLLFRLQLQSVCHVAHLACALTL